MRVLTSPARVELIVQKSRFLGLLEPLVDATAARSSIKNAKNTYTDASHVVHAFRCGPEGSETLGCSDDGEPAGTAGRPVLDVLKGAGGGFCLLLVVRWFGGTKLGTGGLVKAYGDTAKAVIREAQWEELRAWVQARIDVAWGEHRPLLLDLAAHEGRVDSEVFGTSVELKATIPAEHFEALVQRSVDLTRGRSRWLRVD